MKQKQKQKQISIILMERMASDISRQNVKHSNSTSRVNKPGPGARA